MRLIKKLIGRHLGRKYSVELSNYKLASYQHDQCERSLRMHLFSMEKKDLALVLVLMAAIGFLCMILATLAPQSRILETVLIGDQEIHRLIGVRKSSAATSESEQQNSRPVIDMDLEPPNPWLSQESSKVEEEIAANSSTVIMEKVETQFKTIPMNSLNREMNVLAQIEFGLRNSPIKEEDKTELKINFLLGWQMKALIAAKSIKSTRGLTEAAEWANRLLNVTFSCKPPKGDQLSFRCLAPEMSVYSRIEHLDKRAYILNISISGIGLIGSSASAKLNPHSLLDSQMNSSSSSRKNVDLDLDLDPPRIDWIGLKLTLGYTNSTFTFITILARIFFLLVSISIASCFIICLSEHSFRIWSLEQKWTALLLLLLVGANKPMYTLEFLVSPSASSASSSSASSSSASPASEQLDLTTLTGTGNASAPIINPDNCNRNAFTRHGHPAARLTFGLKETSSRNRFDLLDSILELNFICCLLLSWPCFAHSIRQMSRPFLQFYAIKLTIVTSIWMIGVYALVSNTPSAQNARPCNQISPESANGNLPSSTPNQMLLSLNSTFYLALGLYFVNLIYHFGKSALELRQMSYFTLRYRIQLLLCAWMLLNSFLLVFMIGPLHKVQNRPPGSGNALLAVKRQQLADKELAHEYGDNLVHLQSHHRNGPGLDDELVHDLSRVNLGDEEAGSAESGIITSARPDLEAEKVACRDGSQCGAGNEAGSGKLLAAEGAKGEPAAANLGRGSANSLLALMPQTHSLDSPCSFLCYIFLINLYVFISAYFYWPVMDDSGSLPNGNFHHHQDNTNNFQFSLE